MPGTLYSQYQCSIEVHLSQNRMRTILQQLETMEFYVKFIKIQNSQAIYSSRYT